MRKLVLGGTIAGLALALIGGASAVQERQYQSGFKQGPKIAGVLRKERLAKRPPTVVPSLPRFNKTDPLRRLKLNVKLPAVRPPQVGDPAANIALKLRPKKGLPLPRLKAPTRTTRAASAAGRRAAPNDVFTITQVLPSKAQNSSTGEPAISNDRNVVLMTGNWYTAVSTDNGANWTYLDPEQDEVDGGFCCDQVVNASDEDDDELVVWLRQYADDGTDNTIRLTTWEGKSDLTEELQSGTTTHCDYDFQPSDLDLPSKRWFDYPSLENSDEYLYVSANVFDIPAGGADSEFQGYALWRIKLDDLTDGDCSIENGWEYLFDEDHYTATLTQGAGSTMYWGSHHGSSNNELRIFWAGDSEHDYHWTTKSITAFPALAEGDDPSCPTPDGNNPCGRANSKIRTAFAADGKIGFMWVAPQGGSYPFPHTRLALFNASSKALVEEESIWNEDYAWVYPSAGVNSDGDVAVTIYRIGGGQHPRARVFIVDDVSPDWSDLDFVGLRTSDDSPNEARWGDYGRVMRYDGCSKTWLAGVYTMQGGGAKKGDAEAMFVWFGREKNACPDLVVESFAGAYSSALKKLLLADTTRNIGSGPTGQTTETRYYLSRDADKDSSDKLITVDPKHEVPDLAADESHPLLTVGDVPSGSFGTYYLIACADDTELVDEVTETNNCTTGSKTVQIPLSVTVALIKDFQILNLAGYPSVLRPGEQFTLADDARIRDAEDSPPAAVRYYLSPSRQPVDGKLELGSRRIDRWDKLPGGRPGKGSIFGSSGRTTLTIPQALAPGIYYLIACVVPDAKVDDKDARNDCRSGARAIRILPGR